MAANLLPPRRPPGQAARDAQALRERQLEALRDTFAAAALAGTFARTFGFDVTAVVCDAWAAADEMLRVRALTPQARQAERAAREARPR